MYWRKLMSLIYVLFILAIGIIFHTKGRTLKTAFVYNDPVRQLAQEEVVNEEDPPAHVTEYNAIVESLLQSQEKIQEELAKDDLTLEDLQSLVEKYEEEFTDAIFEELESQKSKFADENNENHIADLEVLTDIAQIDRKQLDIDLKARELEILREEKRDEDLDALCSDIDYLTEQYVEARDKLEDATRAITPLLFNNSGNDYLEFMVAQATQMIWSTSASLFSPNQQGLQFSPFSMDFMAYEERMLRRRQQPTYFDIFSQQNLGINLKNIPILNNAQFMNRMNPIQIDYSPVYNITTNTNEAFPFENASRFPSQSRNLFSNGKPYSLTDDLPPANIPVYDVLNADVTEMFKL